MTTDLHVPISRREGDDDTHLRGDRTTTTSLPRAIAQLGLTPDDVDAIGRELDELRAEIIAQRGREDADHIRRVARAQRRFEATGRGLLFLGFLPPAWLAGSACLGLSKILDNMEVGHNVMHGQYDFMNDSSLHSSTFQWDSASPASTWRHSHNVMHHTWTNVLGKDRDIGYGVLRMVEEQPWRPYYLGNPMWALLLATLFEYGVALHDLESDRVLAGERDLDDELREMAAVIGRNAGRQALKDYLLWPALTGPLFVTTLLGNATANLIRNVWAFGIIFCGHFPDDVETFTLDEIADESRGGWYVRQMLGSANITGGPSFHVMTGNLSFQIEHHLFPDLPSYRYAQIAPRVQDLCERYGLPYTTGPLHRQLGQVARTIARLSLPSRDDLARLPLLGRVLGRRDDTEQVLAA